MRRALRSLCIMVLIIGWQLTAWAEQGRMLCFPSELSSPAASALVKVKLNSADVETLDRELVGIGPTKARAIVEHREAYGPFQSVDELLEVKGIGPSILEKNAERLDL